MRKILYFFILTLTFSKISLAQDIIVRKTGDTIICKINKVDADNVTFTIRGSNWSKIKTFISKDSLSSYTYNAKIDKTICSWINLNAGIGEFSSGSGMIGTLSFGINYSLLWRKNLISIHVLRSDETRFLGPSPWEYVIDVAAMYGSCLKSRHFLTSISAGLSYVSGVERGEWLSSQYFFSRYAEKKISTIGLPIEGQLIWIPIRYIGLGFNGYVNINPQKYFMGGSFCILIGKLR